MTIGIRKKTISIFISLCFYKMERNNIQRKYLKLIESLALK